MSQRTLKGFYDRNGEKYDLPQGGGGGSVDVSGKADKVDGATSGNLASLDAEGNLQDSGVKPADFAPASGSTEYAAVDHNHDNDYAAKTHRHFLSDVTGLSDYLTSLSDRISALEDAVIPPSWETVEEITLGVPGAENQNRYSSGDNNLFNLSHYADYRIGDRVRLAGITDTEIVVEGEILAKSTGPDRILLSIDLSSITNNGYHYNLQKVAASNNE